MNDLALYPCRCTPTARSESVCRRTNQSTYRQFSNSSTQGSLEEFISNADLFLSGLSAGGAEGCRQVITNLLCNIVFPPCSNNSAREPLSVCPAYCSCLNGSCASVYRRLRDRQESDVLASMIVYLTERCAPTAMNSSASLPVGARRDTQCVSCPAPMNSNPG